MLNIFLNREDPNLSTTKYSLSHTFVSTCRSPGFNTNCVQAAKTLVRVTGSPKSMKLFSCTTQLSVKFFLLINVKMPTIVGIGILTFMSRKNRVAFSAYLSLKKAEFLAMFKLISISNFMLISVEHETSFITSGPGLTICYFYMLKASFLQLADLERPTGGGNVIIHVTLKEE